MKAEVIVHLDATDIADAPSEATAIRLARGIAERVGKTGDAEVMSSLFDDGYRVSFAVDPVGAAS